MLFGRPLVYITKKVLVLVLVLRCKVLVLVLNIRLGPGLGLERILKSQDLMVDPGAFSIQERPHLV